MTAGQDRFTQGHKKDVAEQVDSLRQLLTHAHYWTPSTVQDAIAGRQLQINELEAERGRLKQVDPPSIENQSAIKNVEANIRLKSVMPNDIAERSMGVDPYVIKAVMKFADEALNPAERDALFGTNPPDRHVIEVTMQLATTPSKFKGFGISEYLDDIDPASKAGVVAKAYEVSDTPYTDAVNLGKGVVFTKSEIGL